MTNQTGQSEFNFEKIFETSIDFVCVLNRTGHAHWMNRQWTTKLGWSERQLLSKPVVEFLHRDDQVEAHTIFYAIKHKSKNVTDFKSRLMRENGEPIWIRWNLISLEDGMIGITGRDITQEISLRNTLTQKNRFLEMATRLARVGYWRVDLRTNELTWSKTIYEFLGFSEKTFEVTPKSNIELYPESDRQRITDITRGAIQSGELVKYKTMILHGDGEYRHTMNHAISERSPETDEPVALFGVSMDITDFEQAISNVSHAALHDPLTALANRIKFSERLEQALVQTRSKGHQVAVVLIDLDHFKEVNDTLGHPVGDELLIRFSQRLRSSTRETETVARLGGDEFAIIQLINDQPSEAQALGNRILKILQEPFEVGGHQIAISTSIGVSVAPGDGIDAETLLRNADIALYRAKNEGRATIRFFEIEMDRNLRERRQLETELKQAIEKNEFVLHYQPVFETQTKTLCSLEALIRWNSPTRGMVPPDSFIPLTEKTRLIVPLGQWVMRQACADAATWPDHIRVAINVSAVEFQHSDLVGSVTRALADAKISADRLELEITETALLRDGEKALHTLHTLRNLGVRIVMDDFGMGYSSLSYLRSFPFDKLKLDRSFVRESDIRPDDRAIVKAVAGMARSLGMETTAEGVETQAHVGIVEDEGYTQVQGYFYSKPRSAKEISDEYFPNVGVPANNR